MNTTESALAQTAGEAFLRLLASRGVDWFFANSGTDFPSIVEGFARARCEGLAVPRPVLVPHENVGVGMAYGVAMVTGRPQAVMVHVNVGTANALCGLINAARENVPLLLAAGRTPINESGPPGSRSLNIHWAQEMFDQAGIVREHVKWDYEVREAGQLEGIIDRALAISMTEPRGPVYLSLPREVLAQVPAQPSSSVPLVHVPAAPPPDPVATRALLRIVAHARMPVIVTSRAGSDPRAVALLETFAERFAIPVVEFRPRYLSLPNTHAMHGGYEIAPWLDDADAIIVLDCDVPWIPSAKAPRPGIPVVHVGPDPLFSRYPVRSFRSDLTIEATSLALLEALVARSDDLAGAIEGIGGPAAIADRRAAIEHRNAARRAGVERQVVSGAQRSPMGLAHVSRCLSEALPADAIMVNEYSLVPAAMTLASAGSFFGSSPVGGLGWGVPAAMGAKLASPGRLVVAAVGDGSYEFANPVACHHTAAMHGIPFLTVVLNNARYGAVERATLAMYPDGLAAREGIPLASLEPSPRFEEVVRACGGHGERVDDPAALPAALARAVSVVRDERRQALLNVICS